LIQTSYIIKKILGAIIKAKINANRNIYKYTKAELNFFSVAVVDRTSGEAPAFSID